MRFALALVLVGFTGCAASGPARRFDLEPSTLRGKSAPILLVHGIIVVGPHPIFGLTTFDRAIVRALTDDGFDVWLPALPAVAPPAARAQALLEAIDQVRARTRAAKVHIIAHSQGGIDTRLLLDDPRAAGKIAAVVTLSTPHAGTPLALWWRRIRGGLFESAVNRIGRDIDRSRGWAVEEDSDFRATAVALTPTAMATFNAAHANPPVPLFSVAGTPEPTSSDGACDGGAWPAPTQLGHRQLVMWVAGQMMDDVEKRHESNDGIVPTRSQRFGIFLGCAPFDHGGWLHRARSGVDVALVILELARGLREVEQSGRVDAMTAHAATLGRLVDRPY